MTNQIKMLLIFASFSFTIVAGCKMEDKEREEIGVEHSISGIEDTRGIIVQEIYNPLDVSNIEVELMNLSQPYFPSTKFFYREGNSIKNISKWLKRESVEPEGLNPPIDIPEDAGWEIRLKLEKESPKYLVVLHLMD